MRLKLPAALVLLAVVASSAFAQARAAGQYDELIALVGIRLDELISRFGAPASVHAVRAGRTGRTTWCSPTRTAISTYTGTGFGRLASAPCRE